MANRSASWVKSTPRFSATSASRIRSHSPNSRCSACFKNDSCKGAKAQRNIIGQTLRLRPLRKIFTFNDVFAFVLRMRDHGSMTAHASSQTIAEYFARAVSARGTEQALGSIQDGRLQWRTWQEVADDAGS